MAHITWGTAQPSSKAAIRLGGFLRGVRSRALAVVRAVQNRAARLSELTGRVRRVWSGVEIVTRAEVEEQLEDLSAARLDTAHWKAQAALYAARVAELEAEVADSKLVAMDLRARLVCLHGKLATTAATARYQSFTSALESRPS